MTGDFRVASFFDPENNFRSTLVLSFSFPVIQNVSPITDADRKEEKEKIKRIFKISPDVVIDSSMIDVQDNAIILEIDLEAQTTYTLSLKSDVRTENNEKRKSWSFTSPENNSFLIRMKEGISLYDTNHTPHIQFISYDSRKNSSIIKVCKIDLETYAKIEIFLKNRDIEQSNKTKIMSGEEHIQKNASEKLSTQEDFFYQGIDALIGSNCAEVSPTYIPDQNEKINVLFKQDISLFDTLEKLGSTGLYVATYADK